MPKAASYRLSWEENENSYLLNYPDGTVRNALQNAQSWHEWLEKCSSFAFVGRQGRMNLLKEARGGESYWYAYRRQGRRIHKKYAGRSLELTLERLEELAHLLEHSEDPLVADPESLPVDSSPTVGVTQNRTGRVSSATLLAPKLSLPRLHSDTLLRPRLLALLDSSLERKLTLVSAPAGFGKTTVVRQWLDAHQASSASNPAFPPVGWFSLDKADNDPTRFWRYLIAACQNFGNNTGQAALVILEAVTQPVFDAHAFESVLVALLNELSRLERGGILVLEDFHHITAPYLQQTFEFFLDHLPPRLHLIIISRTKPHLPLSRLRAMNELGELNALELRFAPAEARFFLEQNLKVTIPAEILSRVDEKLGGWAAGLRLLSFSLNQKTAPEAIIRYLEDFQPGSQRNILEYFVNEVLNAQSEEMQDFIIRTSLLDRLTASLCEAVSGQASSAMFLEKLAHANLFLDVSEGVGLWYRYHALFAEATQQEARRRLGDAGVRQVLSRAGKWYEENGLLEQAVEATLGAGDPERAASLIEQVLSDHAPGGLQAIEVHNLRRWVEQLPRPVLDNHPVLHLNYAVALLFVAMPSQPSAMTLSLMTQSLDTAEASFKAVSNLAGLGEVMAFRSLLARQRGDTKKAVEYALLAQEWLKPEEVAWRSWSLGVLGTEAYLQGDMVTAAERLLRARTLGQIEGNNAYLRANAGMLSGVYGASGELHQAAYYIRQVLEEARAEDDPDDISHAQVALAQLSYEWNQLDEAAEQAQEALELGQHFAHDLIEVEATLTMARIEAANGQITAGLARVGSLLTRLQPHLSPLLFQLYHKARAAQARLKLLEGDFWSVEQWQENRLRDNPIENLPLLQRESDEILIARLWIAQGKYDRALAALEELFAPAMKAGRRRSALEIQLLISLAYNASGRQAEALQLIRSVLAFTRTEGYIRFFLDEGPFMAKLLTQASRTINDDRNIKLYLDTLLEAFNWPSHPKREQLLPEPLTRQEEKVLRLLAAGQTNPQIASELVVSVNTIRSQVKSIYRKLDVNSREEARETARRLHLI
ncbi:MAG TPA: LuxR C-terminal-related transcriptional regulator [Chloroflexia bacterium]|nr:LuxR C-terminal-related transcriptional regulator [Chloroflexia bacterium]